MTWMNRYDVADTYAQLTAHGGVPNLIAGVTVLRRLVDWTDDNSDGWPYWAKPSRAASKLQTILSAVDVHDPEDITAAQLRAALAPIKAFLTRQGVPHSEAFPA